MAVGAHVVPVLVRPRPVQRIGVRDPLVGVEMEPALPALRLRPRVPGDGQALHPPSGELDEVLLEGPVAEGVRDFVVVQGAVGTVGVAPLMS